MNTYLLTMFYPSLEAAQEPVRQCQEIVKSVAGNNWKIIKAAGFDLAIAFASDTPPHVFSRKFEEAGREDFHFLVVEISSVACGWIEPSAYQWIRGRLAQG